MNHKALAEIVEELDRALHKLSLFDKPNPYIAEANHFVNSARRRLASLSDSGEGDDESVERAYLAWMDTDDAAYRNIPAYVAKAGFRSGYVAGLRSHPARQVPEWIAVSERLPEKAGCFLVVIAQPRGKSYVSLAFFGPYEYYTEDAAPRLAPGETLDGDECRVFGKGWHNEEDSHGGEYDTYVVTYFEGCSRGHVTHWQSRPELPAPTPPASDTTEEER
jgi:hypothetical protein